MTLKNRTYFFTLALISMLPSVSAKANECNYPGVFQNPAVTARISLLAQILKTELSKKPLLVSNGVTVVDSGHVAIKTQVVEVAVEVAGEETDLRSSYNAVTVEGISLSNGVKANMPTAIAAGTSIPVVAISDPQLIEATYDEFGRVNVASHCSIKISGYGEFGMYSVLIKNNATGNIFTSVDISSSALSSIWGEVSVPLRP